MGGSVMREVRTPPRVLPPHALLSISKSAVLGRSQIKVTPPQETSVVPTAGAHTPPFAPAAGGAAARGTPPVVPLWKTVGGSLSFVPRARSLSPGPSGAGVRAGA